MSLMADGHFCRSQKGWDVNSPRKAKKPADASPRKMTPDIQPLDISEKDREPIQAPEHGQEPAPPSTDSPRIERSMELWGTLYEFWFHAGGPAGFNYDGDEYIVINDSGIVFIRQGRQPASERYYSHLSIGRTS